MENICLYVCLSFPFMKNFFMLLYICYFGIYQGDILSP